VLDESPNGEIKPIPVIAIRLAILDPYLASREDYRRIISSECISIVESDVHLVFAASDRDEVEITFGIGG
jgi:hypothetical protein